MLYVHYQVCLNVRNVTAQRVRAYGGRLEAIYFESRALGVSDPRLLTIESGSNSTMLIVRPTCVAANSTFDANQCGPRPTAVGPPRRRTRLDVGFAVTNATWTGPAGGPLGCFFIMNAPGFAPEVDIRGWRVGLRFNDLVPPPFLARVSNATRYAGMHRRTFLGLKRCIEKEAKK